MKASLALALAAEADFSGQFVILLDTDHVTSSNQCNTANIEEVTKINNIWPLSHHMVLNPYLFENSPSIHSRSDLNIVVVVADVMMSLSGTAYMGGQRGLEEMRNSTRL